VTHNDKKGKSRRPVALPSVVELIVRRGALRRFDKLKSATAELPVKLTWDRRVNDRRAGGTDVASERRAGDRRKAPPYTWSTADFLVVEAPGPSRPQRRVRAKSKRR
jgi:hypothetical protein